MNESKKKDKSSSEKLKISLTAYTVGKAGSTTAQAYEVKIVDGKLASIKEISRAPDQPATVIMKAVEYLWSAFRSQNASTLNSAIDHE